MRRRFLFVSGCPRSGTTMVTTLLNWNDEAFIAQERYAPLIRREPEALDPSLFEPARLLDFRPRECGYARFSDKPVYWDRVANPKDFAALGDYPVIGDKITHLFRRFGQFSDPEWAGEDITIVHMVRNLRDVVASYLARKHNQDDRWDWGTDEAIQDWTDSMEHAYAFHEDPGRRAALVVVDYDAMFDGDDRHFAGVAERLFEAVGFEFGERQRAAAARLFRQRGEIPKRPALDADTRERLDRSVGSDTLAKYEALRGWSVR